MSLSPAPALFVGLGARIALDYFTRSGEATVRDFILIGVWQGVGLHCASKITTLAIIVGLAIAAKLLIEFNFINDITRTVTTLLGIALGVLCTECLSQFFGSRNSGTGPEQTRKRASSNPDDHALRRDRLVQFHSSIEGDGSEARHRAFRETVHGISDITSVGSHSDMIGPSASLSPLEIEIKTLRARAALADSERRRCKEERKWAISQGNLARASQMKSQVTLYTTLMQKFNMEADAKMLQAPNARPRHIIPEESKPFSSKPSSSRPSSSKLPNRTPREPANRQPNGQGPKPPSKLLARPRREPSGGLPNGQDPRPSSSKQPWPLRYPSSSQPNGQIQHSLETRHPSKHSRP